MSERPQQNLSLELVRATEDAALVAARHRDLGKWDAANPAAANAMRLVLQSPLICLGFLSLGTSHRSLESTVRSVISR